MSALALVQGPGHLPLKKRSMSSAFTRLSWGSELEPGVYCDDAVKKVFVPHSPKAVRLDDLLEVLLWPAAAGGPGFETRARQSQADVCVGGETRDSWREPHLIRKLSDALHKVLVGVGVTGVGLGLGLG